MIIDRVFKAAPPGTVIPKPAARRAFLVRRLGKRRDERAPIYTIPNHSDPKRPYEKGITATEFEAAYRRLMSFGELTHQCFAHTFLAVRLRAPATSRALVDCSYALESPSTTGGACIVTSLG